MFQKILLDDKIRTRCTKTPEQWIAGMLHITCIIRLVLDVYGNNSLCWCLFLLLRFATLPDLSSGNNHSLNVGGFVLLHQFLLRLLDLSAGLPRWVHMLLVGILCLSEICFLFVSFMHSRACSQHDARSFVVLIFGLVCYTNHG